jgi:hypothetical protein
VRFKLTSEGQLQAWARLRENESAEKSRLESMPAFQVLNQVTTVKPGASVLATAVDEQSKEHPALLTQRFGRGRTAAFTIGDFWRWGMASPEARRDLEKAWRQMVRWLVADVPRPVELTVEPGSDGGTEALTLQVRARDNKFQPLEDATVTVEIGAAPGTALGSDGNTNAGSRALRVRAEPSLTEPGVYETTFVPHESGGYIAQASVTNSAGLQVGRAEAGWAEDPGAAEFRSLQPNVALLTELARRTGGELVPAENLAAFTQKLPKRTAPVMEAWTVPAWHTPAMFGFALMCFIAEWGCRRWKGLP